MSIRTFPVMTPIKAVFFTRLAHFVDGRDSDGSCTLAASATSTTVYDAKCGTNSRIFLMPTTADGALAQLTSPGVYVSSKIAGSFVLTHGSSANTDQTFDYYIKN